MSMLRSRELKLQGSGPINSFSIKKGKCMVLNCSVMVQYNNEYSQSTDRLIVQCTTQLRSKLRYGVQTGRYFDTLDTKMTIIS